MIQLKAFEQHVIICGFGHLGQTLAQQLSSQQRKFVVIDAKPQNIETAETLGYYIFKGNPTEEEILLEAGIQQAEILATVLDDEASNVFITLTARELNPKLTILARGNMPETEQKLRLAGADHVVLPAAISAVRLVNLITRPHTLDFLEQSTERSQLIELLNQLDVQIEELVIPKDSPLSNLTIEEVESKAKGALMVIGLRQGNGKLRTNLSPTLALAPGDTLIVLGHQERISLFIRQYAYKTEMRYRGRKV